MYTCTNDNYDNTPSNRYDDVEDFLNMCGEAFPLDVVTLDEREGGARYVNESGDTVLVAVEAEAQVWITDDIVERYNDRNNDGEGFPVGDDSLNCHDAALADGMTVLDTDRTGCEVLARASNGRLVYVGDAHGPWGCYVDEPSN
tara:strand:+ start:55 stop:486 length:432 start_codon:yes stop_codon:yes gene_type:complete